MCFLSDSAIVEFWHRNLSLQMKNYSRYYYNYSWKQQSLILTENIMLLFHISSVLI